MKSPIKACLLSGLVFPGAGQLYLGRRGRGWAFIGSVLVLMAMLVVHMTLVAYEVLVNTANPENIDVDAVNNAVEGATGGITQLGLALIVALWLASIADVFWQSQAGHKKDQDST